METSDAKSGGDDGSSPLSQSEMDALLLGCIKELPAVDVKTSSWKGTLISIVVICALCSAILLAIYIINPDIQYQFTNTMDKERLKLTDWLYGKYSVRSVLNSSWISDTEIVFIDPNGSLKLYNVQNTKLETLVDGSTMKQYEVNDAIMSPNRLHILFVSNSRMVFRHSKLASYHLYHRNTRDVTPVKPDEAKEDEPLNVAQWAPVGSQLAFVYENNLYHMSVTDDGIGSKVTRVTHDKDNYIYNGIPDWIYEEEILAVDAAFWWSHDATQLAYAQFDDRQVELQEYPWYGDIVDTKSQYLDRVRIKYPKPGRVNPGVKLFVVNIEEVSPPRLSEPVEVDPPENFTKNSDYYVAQVSWANTNTLLVVYLTREQTSASFSVCSPSSSPSSVQASPWSCVDAHVAQSTTGWVDVSELYVNPIDRQYFYTLLEDTRSPQQFVQIVKINIQTQHISYLTSLDRDVTAILKLTPTSDGKGVLVYYMATRPDKPGERHAYSLEDRSSSFLYPGESRSLHKHSYVRYQQQSETSRCYTCDRLEEGQCLYNRISLSVNASYYFHECLGPDYPYSTLRASADLRTITNWMDNLELAAKLSNKFLPSVRHELINKTDYVLHIQLVLPPNYDDNDLSRFPLLLNVYGGPGSQNVAHNFHMKYSKYLAGSQDIVYALVDGRGTGFQGQKMKHYLYHNLGTVEIEDQIEAAKYISGKYRINKEAIGIWGWSYGGYATAMILAKDTSNVFKCGVSVAPVTSWLLYDSAYTERYLGLPEKNKKSYFVSDLMHLSNNFKNKKYLLIHGTADDNVHIQNSMALIKSLNHANVMFETQIYPDENHSLSGVSLHLYNRLEQFWNECFQMNSYIEEIGLRRRRIIKQEAAWGV